MAAVENNVIVWEETMEVCKPPSPKAKALQDRLANAQLEKDANDVGQKVLSRLAKAEDLRERITGETMAKLHEKSEKHDLAVAAQQMEAQSAKQMLADKIDAKQDAVAAIKAEQARQRALKMAERDAEHENKRVTRLQQEEEMKQRQADKLKAMEERLAVFNAQREEEAKSFSQSHLDRVARREAILDRMHDSDILNADKFREEIEIKQAEADAKRQALLDQKKEQAAQESRRAAEIAARINAEKEAEASKLQQSMEAEQLAAAERRSEQQALPQSQKMPRSPVKARSPSREREEVESSGSGWARAGAMAVGVAAVAAAFFSHKFVMKQ